MRADKQTPQEKAKELRFKRGALESLGSAWLMRRLDEIGEACDEVAYYMDDDETLLNAMDGSEDEVWEFKMLYADLSADADRLRNAVSDWSFDYDEYDDCTLGLVGLSDREYDDVTVALTGGRFDIYGYDSYEKDYYKLIGGEYVERLAQNECEKRLMQKTKTDMLETIRRAWGVFLAFFDLDQRYIHLQATMDILRGENTAILQIVRQIQALYDEAMSEGPYSEAMKKYDKLLAQLPQRAWVE